MNPESDSLRCKKWMPYPDEKSVTYNEDASIDCYDTICKTNLIDFAVGMDPNAHCKRVCCVFIASLVMEEL